MMRIGMMFLKLSHVILGVINGGYWVYLLIITFFILSSGSSGVCVIVTEIRVCYIDQLSTQCNSTQLN